MAPGVEVARVDSNTGRSAYADSGAHSPDQYSCLSMAGACTRLCSQAFIGKSRTHCLRISTGSKSSEAPAVPSGERMPLTR